MNKLINKRKGSRSRFYSPIRLKRGILSIVAFLTLSALIILSSGGCSTSKKIQSTTEAKTESAVDYGKTTTDNKSGNLNTSNKENRVKVIEVYDTIGVVRREVEYINSERDTQWVYNNIFTDRIVYKDSTKQSVLNKEEQQVLNKILSVDEETRDTIIYSLILILLCIVGLIVLSFSKKSVKDKVIEKIK